ncbi:hypothetical protein [Streptomyces aureus]|uniref:hypothetical protein n=1 Tax=Streptomyces aureus TaxID=193461 RepID=UPI00099BE2DC|nr:hypothetical protein [Streptomyces aureus]
MHEGAARRRRSRNLVGTDNPAEFHNTVFDPNRADHRRPQLDYPLMEKATSDMRAVLREAKASGRITEPVRAWLAGEDSEPDARAGSVADARDRALLGMAFSKEPGHDREVARVLRRGLPTWWNPRLLDGTLYSSFIAKRGNLADRPDWRTALEMSEAEKTQLSDFLVTRDLHWLNARPAQDVPPLGLVLCRRGGISRSARPRRFRRRWSPGCR